MIDPEVKKKLNIEEALEVEAKEDDETSHLSNYKVRLPVFEGPFDLFLNMIDEGKLDLYTVSLTQLISGYFEYIKVMKDLDIAIASEFLLMAAYLIEMKSRMLLPVEEKPEEAEDIDEIERTLLERLHEYKVFKQLAEKLRERKEVFGRTYSRDPGDVLPVEERDVFLTDVTLRDLVSAFQKVWKTVEAKGRAGEIVDEAITISAKISEILEKLKHFKGGLPFEELFTRLIKLEVIVTFLAILELARQRRIEIKQGEKFGSILIFGKEQK